MYRILFIFLFSLGLLAVEEKHRKEEQLKKNEPILWVIAALGGIATGVILDAIRRQEQAAKQT